jgi:guanylate kinase
MIHKDAFVAKLETQLARWSARIDDLTVRARHLGHEARHSIEARIDTRKAKLAAARQKLDALKIIGNDRYDSAKTALERFWKDAKAVLERE